MLLALDRPEAGGCDVSAYQQHPGDHRRGIRFDCAGNRDVLGGRAMMHGAGRLKHAKTCSHRLAAGAFRHTIKDTAMRMRTLILSAVFSIFGMVPASRAQEIGDVQQGRQFALDVCASCHAVRAGQTQSPLATAPSFEEIAHTPGMTPAALTFWLTAQSHPTMPNLILSPQQVRNVSAYLLSLRDN